MGQVDQAAKKQEYPRPTLQAPISLHEVKTPLLAGICRMELPELCGTCGSHLTRHDYFGMVIEQCDTCVGHSIEREKAEERELIRLVSEYHNTEKARAMLAACAIGDRFIGMTFQDYDPTNGKAEQVLRHCQRYVMDFDSRPGAGLLMIGSPGTGKNMLAAIICQELVKAGKACLHTTALKAVRRVKDSWRNKEESEQEVIDTFTAPALLVIDEVGVQFGTATEQLYLTEIINERYERRRATILISNLTMSQLTEVMGIRAIDRFHDDGSKVLVFDWESYRRRRRES